MNIYTKSVFVSRDVVFQENVFPLNKTSTISYLKPLPVDMHVPTSSVLAHTSAHTDDDFDFGIPVENTMGSNTDSAESSEVSNQLRTDTEVQIDSDI